MTTWISILDHDFTLSANTVTGGAGSFTGAGQDGLWADLTGGIWNINGGVLRGKPNPATVAAYQTNFLYRPAAENHTDQRIVITTGLGTLPKCGWYAALRYNSATNQCYLLGYEETGFLRIYRYDGGGVTVTLASSGLAYYTGHQYEIDASCTQSNPTMLSITVTDLTIAATKTLTYALDSTAALQTANKYAIDVNDVANTAPSDYCNISRVRTYYSFSLVPDVQQLLTNTPGQVVNLRGGSTAWTPGAPGVPTFSLSGVTGVTDTQVVSTANDAALTIATGAGYGPLTITDPSTGASCIIPVVQSLTMADSNIVSGKSPCNWNPVGTALQSSASGPYLNIKWTGTRLVLTCDISPMNVTHSLPAGSGSLLTFGFTPMLRVTTDESVFVDIQLPFTASDLTAAPLVIANALTPGTHNTKVQIQAIYQADAFDSWGTSTTDPENMVKFTGIQIDGVTLPPTVQTKNLLCFGDSIDVGWFMKGQAPLTSNDAQRCFGMLLGNRLGAEVGIIGWPGTGYNHAGLGGVPKFGTHWPLYSAKYSRLSAGLFSPQPDYITIYHGTNDLQQTDAQTIADVTAQLPLIRAAAPTALILVGIPIAGYKRTAITTAYNNYITATGDRNFVFLDMGTDMQAGSYFPGDVVGSKAFTDGVHPKDFLHAEIASAMYAAFLRATVGPAIAYTNLRGFNFSKLKLRAMYLSKQAGWSDVTPAPDWGELVNRGLQDFAWDSEYHFDTDTLTLVVGQSEYALTGGYWKYLFTVTNGTTASWYDVKPTTEGVLQRQTNGGWIVAGNGRPLYWWTPRPDTVRFYPPPNSADTITLRGVREPPMLVSDEDMPGFPHTWHEAICLRAAMLHCEPFANTELAMKKLADYRTQYVGMVKACKKFCSDDDAQMQRTVSERLPDRVSLTAGY